MPISKHEPSKPKDPLIAIIVSVLLMSVLTVYPLSYAVSGWRPLFMMMVVLFWVICQPIWCGIWFAFGVGVFLDLLTGAPLGLNALIFVVITFLVRFFTREKRIMTFFNLWVITLITVFAYLFLTWLVQIMAGVQFSFTRHWEPMITSILCWPFIYYMLKQWRT